MIVVSGIGVVGEIWSGERGERKGWRARRESGTWIKY